MLSHHEKRLCRLKAQGLSLKEISELTGLSYGTTRVYFSRIYKKLQIREDNMLTIREASQNQQALRDQ